MDAFLATFVVVLDDGLDLVFDCVAADGFFATVLVFARVVVVKITIMGT